MFLFRRDWIIFPKPKPYFLLDTALLINYISRPRIMTWLRENWRLYHIRCEIRSEINGIGNVASYWVSSWDSWLLLSYLSWILRAYLVAKIVRLVMSLLLHHHHHISIVFLLHHHHISIVFYPSPTRFIFFPPRKSIKDCQLPSLVHFVAMSRAVNNNRGFLNLLTDFPVHQHQLLLKIATPQQLHALVQVLYNIRMGHISIPPKISEYCGPIRMLYLTWPDQTSVTKQRSESLYKRVVVLLKIYLPLLFQA